ncbi:MAG: PIN domain-containing protein [Candidatus Latescibacteria bacterium]|nr:PIN domain-containing protein [Candidatus Latescibacterota bacterium]
MRVYLDTCSIQRPLDDKSQLRNRLEAEAILSILDLVRTGRIELMSSDVLTFEIMRNPHPVRRAFALETILAASICVQHAKTVARRAKELHQTGIAALDSLHLASAEAGEADLFCTCDDLFLRKAKRAVKGKTKAVSPLELAEEIEKWQSQLGH